MSQLQPYAHTLYALSSELTTCSGRTMEDYRSFGACLGLEAIRASALLEVFSRSNRLLEPEVDEALPPISTTKSPRFTLTQRTLSFAALRETCEYPDIGIPSESGCDQAELLFMHSLAWHTSPKRKRPLPSHIPAAILRDVDGKPFAYQKSPGLPTALTWREAVVHTQSGKKRVPAEAIIQYVYDETNAKAGPVFERLGEGLLRDKNLPPPLYITMPRFSAQLLPGSLREQLALVGANACQRDGWDCRRYINSACTFTSKQLATTVCALLNE